MEIARNFARNLKQQRITNNLTQRQLAQKLGYSEKSISKWESGEAIPPSAILPALSEVLHMSIDDFFKSGNEPAYYLGIDGGGTKTEFMLTDRDGKVIKNIVLSGCNPVDIGMDKTFRILEEGIMSACKGVFLNKVAVFAGIAGGITGDNKKKINEFLGKFGFCCFDNDSDAMNAVATALGDGDGIAVILGTGDIAFTKSKGDLYRTGGFGYLFDTGGSGYAIGRDAILEVLSSEQLEKEETQLSVAVKKELGAESLLDCLGEIYESGKRRIASVAPAVFEAYEKGDAVAKEILDRNFRAVARLIIDAARHIDSDSINVRLLGSVTKGAGVREETNRYLCELAPHKKYNVSICKERPIYGALKLAGMEIGNDQN